MTDEETPETEPEPTEAPPEKEQTHSMPEGDKPDDAVEYEPGEVGEPANEEGEA